MAKSKPSKDPITEAYRLQWGAEYLPTAAVTHGKFPAIDSYPCFAILGWVEPRQNSWPIVGLHLSVLNHALDKVIGGLNLGVPLAPLTERHVSCLLEDLGWDGRIWPHDDHGWPEGTEEEAGLSSLLKKAKMGCTLTFPPQAQGTPTVQIPLLTTKPNKAFAVAPFVDAPKVPKLLEVLRKLAVDPSPFKSDWDR